MGSAPPMLPGGGNKNWLSKPENRVTAVFIALLAIIGFFCWGLIVPFVLATLEDTVKAAEMAAILAVMVILVTSKRVHLMARNINRWITGWFVSLDPIGIRKDHIEDMKKRKTEADEAIGTVRGLSNALDMRIGDNTKKLKTLYSQLTMADKTIKNPNADPAMRHEAERVLTAGSKYRSDLEDLLTSEREQAEHYGKCISQMTRLGELCDDVILRTEREIEVQEDREKERQASAKARGAMFKLFGKAGDAGQEMDDMAREQLQASYAEERGQFDQLLAQTSDLIAKDDFNNLAAVQETQNRLEEISTATASRAQQSIPVAELLSVSANKDYFK